MQRIDKPKIEPTIQDLQQKIQVLSALVTRASYASQLGLQFSGERDLYQALGYDLIITYSMYYSHYERQDIAKAIIDRPVKATWSGQLNIIEGQDDKDTALETAWTEINDRLSLKSIFSRVDRLAGIGKYAIIVLGLSDVSKTEDFRKPASGTKNKLMYVKPISEENAKIDTWEKNPNSERFGLPLLYNVKITEPGSSTSMDIFVHYSRVIHIVDDILESEVEGSPRLQAIYNRLMDLEKLVGGGAEMFWRGARGGYQGNVDKDFTLTQTEKDDLINQIDEYEHNLRRILINKGVTYESLQQQLADPKGTFDVLIECISAETGIPKRILMGSERGELSSSEDADEWDAYVQNRRDEFAEPRIVRPFVSICQKYGILPEASTGKYDVQWSDLFAKSEKESVDIGRTRTAAIKEYVSDPTAEMVMPVKAFYQFCLGLKEEDIELIEEMREAQSLILPEEKQEIAVTPEETEIIEKEKTKPKIITQGGSGSGNFGHEGRPGEVGGSGGGVSSGLIEAQKKEGNGYIKADGSLLKVPPQWEDVKYSDNPEGDVVAVGVDSKGRMQVLYSDIHNKEAAYQKFERINRMDKNMRKIDSEIRKDFNAGNEEARCLRLIRETGIRPGSDVDTKAAKKAYGATTLEARHIIEDAKGNVSLQFVGKKGVDLNIPVTDLRMKSMLREAKASKKPHERIFNTNRSKVLHYADKKDGGGFKTKDFRTYVGTSTAKSLVSKMGRPETNSQRKTYIRQVAKEVSKKLGNTPTVALQKYIDPRVFSEWEVK
jgi:DNA topoisomerase IB